MVGMCLPGLCEKDERIMRHRKRGRRLGRSSSHRRALLRNLASSLILTERDAELDSNPPAIKGRIVTTLPKAKEVRPLVEKCVTIARKSLKHEQEAKKHTTKAKRGSDDWRQWREGPEWQEWCAARAPTVAARRRALRLLGNKRAVSILFDEIAPRFEDRDGGYTRILRLAKPRLGDAGQRAILEFVGQNDRVTEKSERPSFGDDQTLQSDAPEEMPEESQVTQPESQLEDQQAEQPEDDRQDEASESEQEPKSDDAS